MEIDPDQLEGRRRYQLLTGTVVPRPIAWVSTVDAAGRRNLAPFSYFQLVSVTPPVLIFSGGRRREGASKDSVENVRATGSFVVNVVDEAHAERMNATSVDAPHAVDEFELLGIEAAPSRTVRAPRVASSPVSFECEAVHLYAVSEGGSTVVFGRIRRIHLRDDLLDGDGRVDPAALRPLARLAGTRYAELGRIFELMRPSWADRE